MPIRNSPIRLNAWPFVAQYGPTTSVRSSNPTRTMVKEFATTQSEALNSTRGTATSVQPRQARFVQPLCPRANPSRCQQSSECTPTCQGQKPTTTTQIRLRTAVTSATCFGAVRLLYLGQGINFGNLASSRTKDNEEAQVQARMDSLMMVITTLCDCIGAVEESNSPNAFAVKMKIVDKINELIDKIEY